MDEQKRYLGVLLPYKKEIEYHFDEPVKEVRSIKLIHNKGTLQILLELGEKNDKD